jgi:hypothetical protein
VNPETGSLESLLSDCILVTNNVRPKASDNLRDLSAPDYGELAVELSQTDSCSLT